MSKSKRILYMSTASKRIVHEETCPCVRNISLDHLAQILEYQVEQGKYHRCKCCSSLGFTLHGLEKNIAVWKEKYHARLDRKGNILYVRTQDGCWRLQYHPESKKFVLMHKNSWTSEQTMQEVIGGSYHLQCDVKPTGHLMSILEYVVRHDQAKANSQGDYRKLHQDSRKQKKYYRKAEAKEKRKAAFRVDDLLSGKCKPDTFKIY